MNIVVALTTFLAPCLPFLLEKVGTPALESASKKLGEDTWSTAKAIWGKLRPKVESEAGAKFAAEKLAEKPESAAWKEEFQDQLATILNNDAALAEAVAKLLQEAQATGGNHVQMTVQENRGMMIGNMSGGEAKNVAGIESVQGDVNL